MDRAATHPRSRLRRFAAAAVCALLLLSLLATACKDAPPPAAEADTAEPAPAAATTAPPTASEPPGDAAAVAPSRREVVLPDLAFEIPTAWQERPPAGSMRVAEFVLPAAQGVPAGAEVTLSVFRFAGGAGGRQANIDRWLGQMQAPDGAPVRDQATIATRSVGELSVTTVDVAGTYVAPVRPGARERLDLPGARLFAVVVEGRGDPYYLKAVGPEATLELWRDALEHLTASMRTP